MSENLGIINTTPEIQYPPADVDQTAWINPIAFEIELAEPILGKSFESTQACVNAVQDLIANVAVATKEIESSTVEIVRSLSWLDDGSGFKSLTFENVKGQKVTFKSVSNWLDKQAADGILGRSKSVVLGTWAAYKNVKVYFESSNAVLNIMDRAGLVNFRTLGSDVKLLDYVRWCGMSKVKCQEEGRDAEGKQAIQTLVNQSYQLSTADFQKKVKPYRDGLAGKRLALKTELRSSELASLVTILHDCENSKDEKVKKIGVRIHSLIYTTSK